MPRRASGNLISMRDIIAQPLGALPDAVRAALQRPEPLVMAEVTGVIEQCAYVLMRATEALSCADAAAFAALMRLLFEALTHSAAAYEQGVQVFALQPSHLHTLQSLFHRVTEQHALPLHSDAAVELVHVIGSLCDADALKDLCGEQFMAMLVRVLQELYCTGEDGASGVVDEESVDKWGGSGGSGDAAQDASAAVAATTRQHVAMHRAVATALINLVKGSRSNKLRAVSWRCVALCCVRSVDVFFQLQCIELLFRVSRQRREVLDDAAALLPRDVAQQLRALPNGPTLLQSMTNLVARMNDGRATVLHYPLRQVTIAEAMLPSSHDAYFTPAYFVVLITASDADHVTVPYDHIRSVTLGKDGRVVVRLDTFPPKLERLLAHVAGMDTVTLHMSLDTLHAFKQSAVRGWVTGVLHARKRAAARSHEHSNDNDDDDDDDNDERSRRDKDPGDEDGAARAKAPAHASLEPAAHNADVEARKPTVAAELQHAPTLQVTARTPPPRAAASTARPASAAASNIGTAAGSVGVGNAALVPSGGSRGGVDVDTDYHTAGDASSGGYAADGLGGACGDAVAEVAVSTVLPHMQKVLAQLRRVRAAKQELRRARAADGVSACMHRAQGVVEATRQQTHALRTSWYDEADAALRRVEQVIADAHDVAAVSVQQLNDDLHELKSSNQALNDRLSCAELELQQALQLSRDRETDDMRNLRSLCEHAGTQMEHVRGLELLRDDAPHAPPLHALRL